MATTTQPARRRRKISKPYLDERRSASEGRWCITVREDALVRVYAGKTREAARRLAGLRPENTTTRRAGR